MHLLSIYSLPAIGFSDLMPFKNEVECRHQEERDECTGSKASHDYLSKRSIDLSSLSFCKCHRYDSENRCQRAHEYRSEPCGSTFSRLP